MKIARPAGALCLAGLVTAAASAQTLASAGPEAEPKVSPLLGQVLDQVLPSAPGEAGLFRRLAQQHPATVAPRAAPAPTAMVPALAYAMEQLDPGSFAVLRPIPVAGAGALLRTGDVFVLQFSTSLPGRVRLENVDAAGRSVDLGTYTVLVDQLNRIPRDKGIQLQGQPGLERLRFYFYPCVPPEAAGKAWAAEFQGRLPSCGSTRALQSASAHTYGAVAPRALVNLAQPDANLAIAGSNEYQPGEVTLMEAQIRHEGRGHAR